MDTSVATVAQTFDTAGALALIVSLFLPILVGLANKQSTHPGLKAIELLGLSVLTSVVKNAYDAAENHVHWNWQPVVYSAVIAFITGIAIQRGLWKPTGLSAAAARVINADPVSVVDTPVTTSASSPMQLPGVADPSSFLQAVGLAPADETPEEYYARVYAQTPGSAPMVSDPNVVPPVIDDTQDIPKVVETATPIGDAAAAASKRYNRKAPAKLISPLPPAKKAAAKVPTKKAPAKKAAPVKRTR